MSSSLPREFPVHTKLILSRKKKAIALILSFSFWAAILSTGPATSELPLLIIWGLVVLAGTLFFLRRFIAGSDAILRFDDMSASLGVANEWRQISPPVTLQMEEPRRFIVHSREVSFDFTFKDETETLAAASLLRSTYPASSRYS